MPILLLLIFVGVPIMEIAVFIEAGEWIGLWPTLAIILLTAIAGTTLLRMQGFSVIRRIQARSEAGEAPLFELFEGLCLLVAGLLLLTPGFVTDTVGFLLFLPPLRQGMGRWIARRFRLVGATAFGHAGAGRGFAQDGDVVDGDFTRVDPEPPRPLDRPDRGNML